MEDVVVLLIIWILAMLIIIVSLARQAPKPTPDVNISIGGINLPIIGIQRFNQPFWVNDLMAGIPIDFGSYNLTIKKDHLLVNDQVIKVIPRLTKVTVYSVEFDFKIILYRGSPFIKTNLMVSNAFYRKNGYIWLKLDLPSFYGDLTPLILPEHIRLTDNLISISWSQPIHYWIPKYLLAGWSGEILTELNNKVLVYGKSWQFQYQSKPYQLVNNLTANIFDQQLVYNIEVGQIEPIPLVASLVKKCFYHEGIPRNQAQRDRLLLLATSLLNYQPNIRFCLIPMVDIYLMRVNNNQFDLNEALSILASLIKWSSLNN